MALSVFFSRVFAFFRKLKFKVFSDLWSLHKFSPLASKQKTKRERESEYFMHFIDYWVPQLTGFVWQQIVLIIFKNEFFFFKSENHKASLPIECVCMCVCVQLINLNQFIWNVNEKNILNHFAPSKAAAFDILNHWGFLKVLFFILREENIKCIDIINIKEIFSLTV